MCLSCRGGDQYAVSSAASIASLILSAGVLPRRTGYVFHTGAGMSTSLAVCGDSGSGWT
jgi:hypothetical protein